MFIDFWRNRKRSNSIPVMGEEAEAMEEFNYLGVYLDNRLERRCNYEAVYKKEQSRLYFLTNLNPHSHRMSAGVVLLSQIEAIVFNVV